MTDPQGSRGFFAASSRSEPRFARPWGLLQEPQDVPALAAGCSWWPAGWRSPSRSLKKVAPRVKSSDSCFPETGPWPQDGGKAHFPASDLQELGFTFGHFRLPHSAVRRFRSPMRH